MDTVRLDRKRIPLLCNSYGDIWINTSWNEIKFMEISQTPMTSVVDVISKTLDVFLSLHLDLIFSCIIKMEEPTERCLCLLREHQRIPEGIQVGNYVY